MSNSVSLSTIILLAIVCGLVLPVLWFAFLHRIRAGQFKTLGESSSNKMMKTSIGTLRINKKHGRVQIKDHEGNWNAVAFNEIRGLRLERDQTDSMFLEILTGFNVFDFWSEFRDQNITMQISLVTHDNVTIPLFFASQYEQREYWMEGIWLSFMQSVCQKAKLYQPIERYCDTVFDKLQSDLQYYGVDAHPC